MSSNSQTAPTHPAIALTGGGSGGHITPLLSLARELKNRAPTSRIIYIGLKGEKLDRLKDEYAVFDEVYYVSSGKFRRYHGESLLSHVLDIKTLALNALDLFKVLAGIYESVRVLRRCRPDVLFSKGSFVAVPVGIAAKLKSIRIVTHDSDSVPGLANRIIGRWADIHATAMPPEYYNYPKAKTRYVGIPLGSNIKFVDEQLKQNFRQELAIPSDHKVILVSGGGLGAKSLNEMVSAMVPDLLKSNPNLTLLHISGSDHQADLTTDYQKNLDPNDKQKVRVAGFVTDFYKYSGAADLVISRAGATTLAELATQGKTCIIIPSPHLTGGHQLKNAHHLKEIGAAEILPNNATPHELLNKTTELLNDNARSAQLAEKLKATSKPAAASELAQILLDTARNHG